MALQHVVLAKPKMVERIRKPRTAITRVAADQSLAKPREFTPQEAREIAEKGKRSILQKGFPEDFAERFRKETEEMLKEPLGW